MRGCPLSIAIPLGPDDVNPMILAHESLPNDEEWITSAEVTELCVVRNGAPGLVGLLGRISEYDVSIQQGLLPLFVGVVLVELSPPKPRHNRLPIQWPGKASINGIEVGSDQSN